MRKCLEYQSLARRAVNENLETQPKYEYERDLEGFEETIKDTQNNYYKSFSMGATVPKRICPLCEQEKDKTVIIKGRSVGASTELATEYCKHMENNNQKVLYTHEFPELMNLPHQQTWFELMLSNKKELSRWLEIQYHDLIKSAERIDCYCDEFVNLKPRKSANLHADSSYELEDLNKKQSWIKTIIAQKKLHAKWIGEILNKRGIDSTVLQDDQYWNWKNLPYPDDMNFSQFCALSAEYEQINRNKFTIFAENEFSPKELKNVFKKILSQKQFHIKAFMEMSGEEYKNVHELIKTYKLEKIDEKE